MFIAIHEHANVMRTDLEAQRNRSFSHRRIVYLRFPLLLDRTYSTALPTPKLCEDRSGAKRFAQSFKELRGVFEYFCQAGATSPAKKPASFAAVRSPTPAN